MLSLEHWRLCQKLRLEMAASRSASRMFLKMRSIREDMVAAIISGCTDGEPRWTWNGKEDRFTGEMREVKLVGRGKKKRFKNAMDDLKEDLRSIGYGVVDTIGGYREEGVDIDEPSYIAAKSTDQNRESLVEELLELSKKYSQEGVIIKLPGEHEAYEYKPGYDDPTTRLTPNDTKSTRVWYGDPTMSSKDPPYYTHLRKGPNPKKRKLIYPQAWERGDEPFDPDKTIPPGE